jgi:hypothetical protein
MSATGPNEQFFPYFDKGRNLLGHGTAEQIRELGQYVMVAEGAILGRLGMFLQVQPPDDPTYPLALELTARTKVRGKKETCEKALARSAKQGMGIVVERTLLINWRTKTYRQGGGAHIGQYLGWTRTSPRQVNMHLRRLHGGADLTSYLRYPETLPQLENLIEEQPTTPGFADFMPAAIEYLIQNTPEKDGNGARIDPVAWYGQSQRYPKPEH